MWIAIHNYTIEKIVFLFHRTERSSEQTKIVQQTQNKFHGLQLSLIQFVKSVLFLWQDIGIFDIIKTSDTRCSFLHSLLMWKFHTLSLISQHRWLGTPKVLNIRSPIRLKKNVCNSNIKSCFSNLWMNKRNVNQSTFV